METLNVKLTFDMQKALLALRKPYEDMAATLHRVLESSLPEMQVANTRILKRSEKRWPLILTDEQAKAHELQRFIAEMRENGFDDSDEDLIEMFNDEDEFDEDEFDGTDSQYSLNPAVWSHPSDVKIKVVRQLTMKALHKRKSGTSFALYDLVAKACPEMHKIGGAPTARLFAVLMRSPCFMRHVTRVGGNGYTSLKLRKV